MIGLGDVSRETRDRLDIYARLLKKWNRHINLVSRDSLGDLWTRHMADSAQLHDLVRHPVRHWADLGSGGGFPGLVMAILGQARGSPVSVTLVESDQRKAAFLRTVVRETGVRAKVLTGRAEVLPPLDANVLSARALAPLPTLLALADRHLAPDGKAVFPKGAGWKKELEEAQSKWNFSCRAVKSGTQGGAIVLIVAGVSRD